MKAFKVDRYEETSNELPEDLLRVHPSRDTRPWWNRIKLSIWNGSEKVRGKKVTYKGIRGTIDL
jgi:hypothetical protein|tara:strand:+ start:1775 stop:1966 length:192 start_codon:yes stop_codon:yes gene_type:complete